MTAARRAWALLAAGLVLALAVLAVRLHVDREFAAFLPRGGDATQRFVAAQLRDSAAARIVLIRLRGADRATLAAASEGLRAALAADPAFAFAGNGSLASGEREVPAVHAARYVLSADAATRMSAAGLAVALRHDLDALSGSAGFLAKRWLADDPTNETLTLLGALAGTQSLRREAGVWFDARGEAALLVAGTAAPSSDPARQQAAMRTLESDFAGVHAPAAVSLEYSSAAFLAARSEATIAHDVERLSTVATLGIIAILALAYRSLPVVLLCALPALGGLVAGVCAVSLGFGSVHALTLAFGTTLVGEAVDYPSYVLTALTPGASWPCVRQGLRRPFALAVLTTACGALAFLASGVQGLVEVGVLTIVGILVSGALAWWFVPRVIAPDWRFGAAQPMHGRSLPSLAAASAGWWTRVPIRVAIAAVVSLALLLAARGHPLWNDDLARMSPVPPAAIALDQSLRAASGAPDVGRFLLVRGADIDAVLTTTERLATALDAARGAGEIDGYEAVTTWLPSAATQRVRRAALPDAPTLAANLAEAVQGMPFRVETFAPFLRDVAAARAAPPLEAGAYAGTALGARVDALMGRDDAGAWSIVPLRGVRHDTALASRVAAVGDGVTLVDLHAASTALFGNLRARTLTAVCVGLVAVYALLAAGLRAPVRAALVVAPALVGALWAALLVTAFAGGLSIFHLIALLLVVGIGVNYALFAQSAHARGVSRIGLVRTLAVVSATTCFAFGVLAMSSIPVLRAVGLTVLAGTVSTLVVCALAFAGDRKAGGA
ncbi:MAG TPA: hypothetical protein VGR63_05160 [Casimicrobiaceae bacterium]|nr:hypothetical protein [Casimicrobiaceae bacterium]